MLDLDPYGGTDPLGMFPLFLKKTADVMATCLSVVFWRVVVSVVSWLAGNMYQKLNIYYFIITKTNYKYVDNYNIIGYIE